MPDVSDIGSVSTRPDRRCADPRQCVRNCGPGLSSGYADARAETGIGPD